MKSQFAELFENSLQQNVKEGEVVKGTVVAIHGKDVMEGVKGAASYLDMMRARPLCKKVSADQSKALEAMAARKK